MTGNIDLTFLTVLLKDLTRNKFDCFGCMFEHVPIHLF